MLEMLPRRTATRGVDPRGVWENDLGEELTENFGLEEEAIPFCEEDFKKFLQERR